MKSNSRAITVGAFILAGLVIFVTGVLVLGGQQKRFVKTVQVKAVFNDVGGLKAGNNVWFSGVKIGTIKRMNFYGQSQIEVIMNIEESAQPYIRKDALATIGSDGLIGNKIVSLVGGSPNTPVIEDGDRLRVREGLSQEQIVETLQENNRNLLKITNDVKSIIGQVKAGKGLAGAILTDTVLPYRFQHMVAGLDKASTQASNVAGQLAQLSGRMNKPGTLVYDLTSDTAVYASLRQTSVKLRQVSNNAVDVSQNLKTATEKLNDRNNAVGALLNDADVNRDIKSTVRNLNTGTQKLNESLDAVQNSFLLRGFFRKKKKEQEEQKERNQSQPAQVSAVPNTSGDKAVQLNLPDPANATTVTTKVP